MALVFNTTIIPLDELPSPYILLPPHQVHDIVLSTYIHLGTFSVRFDMCCTLNYDSKGTVYRYLSGMFSITSGATGGLGLLSSKSSSLLYILQLGVLVAHVYGKLRPIYLISRITLLAYTIGRAVLISKLRPLAEPINL